MANQVGTVNFALNREWKYSSFVSKSAIRLFYGRSASFFEISTNSV